MKSRQGLSLIAACLFFISFSSSAFPVNELLTLDFLPRYSVMNSSAFADDNSALFLNPACLTRVDRFNAIFSTTTLDNVSYLGVGGIISGVPGSFAFGIYQQPADSGTKQGMGLGWAIDWMGFLSTGISVKTVSTNTWDISQGIYADLGLLLSVNENMGWDFLANPFIQNKIFLSFVAQNLGKTPASLSADQMSLRLGLGYDFSLIWTKFFVEKVFLADGEPWILGFEINPEPDFLKILHFRFSSDLQSFRIGAGLSGDDFSVDGAYHFSDQSFQFSFTGYFEQNRQERSMEMLEEGMNLLSDGQDYEKQNNADMAFDRYREALHRFQQALALDRNNAKAQTRISQISDKMSDYKSYYVDKAKANEASQDYISALINYNAAYKVDEDSSIGQKIKELMARPQLQSAIKARKNKVRQNLSKGKYLAAASGAEKLLLLIPEDGEVKSWRDQSRGQLKTIAERYYSKAQTLYNRGQYEDAITQARQALTYNPKMTRARDLINLANTDLGARKGYEKVMTLYKKQNYVGALKMANYILSRTPDNKDVADLRTRIMKTLTGQVPEYLENGKQSYNAGDYEDAIEKFNVVLLVDPGNSAAQDYRNRAVTKQKAAQTLGGLEEE